KNVSMKKTMKDQSTNSDRRDFLKATTGALGAISAFPGIISAQTVTNAIKIGLIGCGGRGSGAASQALQADDYGELTPLDIDQANVEKCLESLKRYPKIRDRIKVEDANRFLGLDAYQRVIESGVDVVLLATPPGFRPTHLAACIAANKHIFCEKPISTDAPG